MICTTKESSIAIDPDSVSSFSSFFINPSCLSSFNSFQTASGLFKKIHLQPSIDEGLFNPQIKDELSIIIFFPELEKPKLNNADIDTVVEKPQKFIVKTNSPQEVPCTAIFNHSGLWVSLNETKGTPISEAETQPPSFYSIQKPTLSSGGPTFDEGSGRADFGDDPDILSFIGFLADSLCFNHPIVISGVKYKFSAFADTLLLHIYRENQGGKARINRLEEKSQKFEAGGCITHLNKIPEEALKKLAQRIQETPGQNLGFIVFEEKVRFYPENHFIPHLEWKMPNRILDNPQLAAELANLFYNVDHATILNKSPSKIFDHLFETARVIYEKELKSIDEPFLSITKKSAGPESDDVHYRLKLFLVKYLATQLGFRGFKDTAKILELIHTEHPQLYGTVIPDISIDKKAAKYSGEAFEVVTLIAQGLYPTKQIDATIDKYVGLSFKKVNIILEPFAFLLHLKKLIQKEHIHKYLKAAGKRDFDLQFYTINVQKESLIPLENVRSNLNSFIKKTGRLEQNESEK